MPLRLAVLAFLALAFSGCVSLTQPIFDSLFDKNRVQISGTVGYRDGTAVLMAKVVASTGEKTSTDAAGTFRLMVPRSAADSVQLIFQDGYEPGRTYASTHYNSIKLLPDRDRRVSVVLIYSTPI